MVKATGDAIPREPEKLKMAGHRSKVTKVIFHPKFNQVASSSEDGSIKVWDYETGECEQSLREHTGMVNYINFHPTGNFLASCSKDMTIKLWRLTSDQEFKCFKTLQGHEHEVSCVEYLRPNGDHLVSCSRDETIRIWDSSSGFLLQTLQQHSGWVRRIAQQGKLMASASKDETVIIWSMDRIVQNLSMASGVDQSDYIITMIDEHQHVIDCIRFAPESACRTIEGADYSKMALDPNQTTGSGDNVNDSTGDQTRGADDSELMEESKRLDETTTEEKSSIATRVRLLKERLRKKKDELAGKDTGPEEQDPDQSVQIDTTQQEAEVKKGGPFKEYIATGSRDKKIRIFEVRSGRCVLTLAGHDNWVTDLLFHPNGRYLMSTADDKSVRIWDLSMGRCYRKIYNAHDHFISSFDMRGKVAVTGSQDTSVKIWACR